NSVTLDRAPETAAGAGGNCKGGGALLTLNTLSGAMGGQNKAYVTGTFGTGATLTFAVNGTFNQPTRLIGYGTTRGDGIHAALTLQTNTGITGISNTANEFYVEG